MRPVALAAVAVAAIVVVFLVDRHNSSTDRVSAGRNNTHTTDAAGRAGQGVSKGQVNAGGRAGSATAGAAAGNTVSTSAPLPVVVTIGHTAGLRDGDAVSIHVVPKQGSTIYGFEAYLCKGGIDYVLDADVRPTSGGNCVPPPTPLSPNSQSFLQVKGSPPYAAADGSFKVGVGSTSYRTQEKGTVTVACGPDHPCSLVLKLQYPNGYGFETIPLTFR